jgi:hypothetical protein
MSIDQLRIHKNISDEKFDEIYSFEIRELSERHWTAVFVAKVASDFFCNQKPVKILDIGSGVGKFCFVGAALHPASQFHGVDIRQNFIDISNQIKNTYALYNTVFFQKNVLDINFDGYDGIYFFNSFQEKIDTTSALDYKSEISIEKYIAYTTHILKELNKMPAGTKLATYYSEDFCVPPSFKRIETHFEGKLKFYLKDFHDGDLQAYMDNDRLADHIDKHILY